VLGVFEAGRFSSSAARVGLPDLEYSKPLCFPTPAARRCARWIGWTTAPVAGSGPDLCAGPGCKTQPCVSSFDKLSPGRGGRRLEQVGACDDGDWLARLDHQHRCSPRSSGSKASSREESTPTWLSGASIAADTPVVTTAGRGTRDRAASSPGGVPDNTLPVRIVDHGQLRDAVTAASGRWLRHRLARLHGDKLGTPCACASRTSRMRTAPSRARYRSAHPLIVEELLR